MKTFDYTISATAFGLVPIGTINGAFEDYADVFKEVFLPLCDRAQRETSAVCKNTNPSMSMLYNAFYEPVQIKCYEFLDNFHMDSIYADSGGLQMITAGKTITPELKKEVYRLQEYADLAMCFDVIPLRSLSTVRTKNERSNPANKQFIKEELSAAGKATGLNIKEQIASFRASGAKTKVLIIVQGNSAETMLTFYRNVASVLAADDYEYVAGIAVADTCIGNGVLESIEMLRAASLISLEAHPAAVKQLHLLGVGSLNRIRPVVYLAQSGYLDKFDKISYDSSTHSSSFDFGQLRMNGNNYKLGQYKTLEGVQHFENVYNLFRDELQDYVNFDEFLDLLYGPGKYNSAQTEWKHSQIKRRAREQTDKNKGAVALAIKSLHTYYQVIKFIEDVDKLWVEKYPATGDIKTFGYMKKLRSIKNDEQMVDWFDEFSGIATSKRIRKSANNLRDIMNAKTL